MSRSKQAFVAAPALLLCASGAMAQAIEPLGAELQVNAYTVGTLAKPAVAVAPTGGFVVVWDDPGELDPTDFTNQAVRARGFSPDGDPAGAEVVLSPPAPPVVQLDPVVAASSAGFVVTWLGYDGSAVPFVAGRGFEPDGSPVGAFFEIPSAPADDIDELGIAARGGDEFLVVWTRIPAGERGLQSGDPVIELTRIELDGTTIAGPTRVNVSSGDTQLEPSVSAASDGSFQVAWSTASCPFLCESAGVRVRSYGSDGAPLGGDLALAGGLIGDFALAQDVDARPDGSFQVIWNAGNGELQGRAIDADGDPVGADFVAAPPGAIGNARAAVGDDGTAFVIWTAEVEGGTDDGRSVQGRFVSADGTPFGAPEQLNVYTADEQRNPAVAARPQGDFVAVWTSGSGAGVSAGHRSFVRRFRARPPIFADDFENGDLAAWSEQVPALSRRAR